jgi:hypothetical protein
MILLHSWALKTSLMLRYRVSSHVEEVPNLVSTCGDCGDPVGPGHKCDVCESFMHGFCGEGIGDEGYEVRVRQLQVP